jgi:hypothetical protein
MIYRIDWTFRIVLLMLTVFTGVIALRPLIYPPRDVLAQAARFDHINILSPTFLYKGAQGLLLMDKRNGNVWFIPKGNDTSQAPFSGAPAYIFRIPFEKLDSAPQ